jgi:uncharacterized delta-60 repeat protein
MFPRNQHPLRLAVVLLLAGCSFLAGAIEARADGGLDGSFNPIANGVSDPPTVGQVFVVAVQADGKILIGGSFSVINGVERSRLARLNTDGSLDTSFAPVLNFIVNAIVVQADQKILIGGQFTTVNGASRNRIARLNTDGSLDTFFNPGTGADAVVTSVVVQADQKIVIGGAFNTINGAGRNYIARLNTNGSLDDSFTPTPGPNSPVFTLALQLDQKILIGGQFTSVDGAERAFIARLKTNGIIDTTFTPMPGTTNTVFTIAVQADGKIIVGGEFNGVNGVERVRIARLNTDGSLDTSFNPGANNTVNTIVVQPDQKILIGGDFTTVNGATRNHIARLNANGSLDSLFNPATGTSGPVYSIAMQADRKIVICGQFATVNNIPHTSIARLLGTGQFPADFDGDTRADVSIWNPSNHNWYIIQSSNSVTRLQLDWGNGSLGDIAVPGDYDGDTKTDIAVWRPSEGNWYILQSQSNTVSLRGWGASSDTPVPADYDGDGKTDIAVWRGSEGNWYIIGSTGGGTVQSWGSNALGDIPVPADYDGDGRADIAVFRPSEGNWYIKKSNNGSPVGAMQNWGGSTDKLVPADYDGDGKTDIAVYRPGEGSWHIINSTNGTVTLKGWGASGDIPVPADYDGDGRADIAIFRPFEGNWYIIRSFTGAAQLQYLGGSTDVPAPSAYLPR